MRVNLQHHEKPFWRLFTASFSNPVGRGYFITNFIEAGLNFAQQAVVVKNTLTKSIYPPQLSNQATYYESTTYPLINHHS